MKHAIATLALVLLPMAGSAAILPDTIGEYHRTGSSQPALADRPVWSDYNLKDWETASYQNGTAKFTVAAWQTGRYHRVASGVRLAAPGGCQAFQTRAAGRRNIHLAGLGARQLSVFI